MEMVAAHLATWKQVGLAQEEARQVQTPALKFVEMDLTCCSMDVMMAICSMEMAVISTAMWRLDTTAQEEEHQIIVIQDGDRW